MDNLTPLQKEAKKLIRLLLIGVIMSAVLTINALRTYGGGIKSLEDCLVILAMALYPIGIVYGWRSILSGYKNIINSDKIGRQSLGYMSTAITISTHMAAFVFVLCIGWIVGVYNAVTRYIQLRKEYAR